MATKEDYRDTLDRMHVKAVTKVLDAGHALQPNKVACIAVVHEVREKLEAHYGKGKIPTDALLAMRDYMAAWK